MGLQGLNDAMGNDVIERDLGLPGFQTLCTIRFSLGQFEGCMEGELGGTLERFDHALSNDLSDSLNR